MRAVPFLPFGTPRTGLSAAPSLGPFLGPHGSRTEIRFVSPARLSRRRPGSANKTQPLDPTAAIAPILNHVPALAVGVDLLNSHDLCTFDARNERRQGALVIIHWRSNLRHDQKLRRPGRIVGSVLDIETASSKARYSRARRCPIEQSVKGRPSL